MNDDNSDKSFTRLFTINDFGRICRMCLIDLNLDNVSNMAIGDIRDLLDYSVQVEIECPDRLPQNVCSACIEELHRSCEFKRLILNNDVILKKSLREVDQVDTKYDIIIDLHSLVDDNESSASYITNDESENNVLSENANNLTVELKKEHIYSCSHCGNGFIGLDLLTQHEKTHKNTEGIDENEKAGELTHNLCETDFQRATSSATTVRTLMKRHDQEPSRLEAQQGKKTTIIVEDPHKFTCEVCGKKYAKTANLKIHMRTHTGEKPFECEYCEKKFYHSSHLREHIRRHTGEKPFQCSVCLKRFTITAERTVHMRIHTGEKPYACNCCEKRYIKASDLQVHMRSHTGEKPFSCIHCAKKFTSGYMLNSHLKTHTGDRPWVCDICSKTFTQSSHLTVHMKKHTGEKFSCKVCPEQFAHSSQLTVHMREHTGRQPYKCTMCERVCNYSSELQSHMTKHTGGKFACITCDKKFTTATYLQEHTRTHTGENLFSCTTCERVFTRATYLEKHLRTHTAHR